MQLPSFADIRALPQQFDRDTAIHQARSLSQGNLGVPLLLLMLLGMMILPLPAFLLDLFFSFNIALSIVVLLVGIYTLRPLDFAVFPTILLVATLMRLALNVASTRVVLLEGHNGGDAAGKVIQAFGEVVIGGNYAVGLIIFIILMIINFVVVTKGAGRISEVSARFTLDAMPGKQMAIDADLNAGLIDQDQARIRREEVAGEADFYGAMDGASKFVRGDAVAGILILVLNVVGGLIVGMAQHELSFAEAGEKYVLLTIGDGLVAQIPSLLLSTSAAIMVTRVNSSEDMRSQVMGQMFDSPKALGVAAGVLFLMGSIPGMPHFSFLSLAFVTGTVAFFIHKRNTATKEGGSESTARSAAPASAGQAGAGELVPVAGAVEPPDINEEISWDDVVPVDVVGLEVGYRIIPLVDTNQNGELLGRIKGVRKKLSQDVGFLIPSVHIRDNLDLNPTAYKISLMGVTLGEAEVYPDSFLAIDPGQVFGKLEGIQTQDPAFGLDAVWIEESKKDHAQTMGYTVVDAATVIATHLNQILQKHAYELLGHEDVQKLLDILSEKSPKLAEELVPNTISLNVLLKVLQGLLQEGVSIRDMRSIAEAITANSDKSQDPVALKAAARISLARQIVQGLVGSEPELPVMTLDPQLEQLLLGSVQQAQKSGNDDGAFIEPGLAERLQQALINAAQQQELAGKPIILLVAAPLRELMVKFNRFSVPEMRVLAYTEIPDNKQITIEMAVSVDGP
ncbi:flagellar biosynthesis protein FlhA [uncultured Pseudoteredinibacter sp.]|uniref:flagellar biosynthesis protein FlhA n=1 Tax=uncultured Pseudoteredinibacter sp. TaxID=1641701 RepID=UPI002622377B|nr:flagellar biosynthesis protein FlhA [uncultured Pseudoteredinibacter sp.]